MIWWIILIVVLVLLVVILLGATAYFYRFSIQRADPEKTEEEICGTPDLWSDFSEKMKVGQTILRGETAELVEITSYDGLKLKGIHVPADTPEPRGTCIVFHGYRSLATVDFAPEVKFLHELGYRLIVPYQRSHGLSEGRYITYGVKERFDCRSWARYTAERFGGGDIFLMGISMGCATVLMAADLELPENVRGIVGDCGFTTPWDIMGYVAKRDFPWLPLFPLMNTVDLLARVRAGFSLKGADTRKALAATKLPVLFIHGDKDDFVPYFMSEENYKACAGEKEFYTVAGAGHAQSYCMDTEGCEKKIGEFLEKYSTVKN